MGMLLTRSSEECVNSWKIRKKGMRKICYLGGVVVPIPKTRRRYIYSR